MILSELLKTLRTHMLMSQETFAKEMNVTVCTINRWENGKSKRAAFLRRLHTISLPA